MAKGAKVGGGGIILNFAVKGGRLFEGGDYSRDGYYSRKCGTSKGMQQCQ